MEALPLSVAGSEGVVTWWSMTLSSIDDVTLFVPTCPWVYSQSHRGLLFVDADGAGE